MAGPSARSTDLIHEIGGMIVRSDFAEGDWDSLAVVATVDEGSVSVSGYTYTDGGPPQAGSPGGFDLFDRFRELADVLAKPDGSRWKTALVQIVRATGAINIDFKWSDRDRWKVTPANWTTMPESLRPQT